MYAKNLYTMTSSRQLHLSFHLIYALSLYRKYFLTGYDACLQHFYLLFCLTLPYSDVCSLKPCGHLLGKGWHLGLLVCDVFLCFVTFLFDVLGQVSALDCTPDICLFLCFKNERHKIVGDVVYTRYRWYIVIDSIDIKVLILEN